MPFQSLHAEFRSPQVEVWWIGRRQTAAAATAAAAAEPERVPWPVTEHEPSRVH